MWISILPTPHTTMQEPSVKRCKLLAVAAACASDCFLEAYALILIVQLCNDQIKLMHELKSAAAKRRQPKQRMLWSQFQGTCSLSEFQFRRMFRMPRGCFEELCTSIKNAVGEDEFKSEEYLRNIKEEGASSIPGRMHHAHVGQSGGHICGEIKLAITLRMLAGGSYLDLAALYVVGFTYVHEIFHHVNGSWICNDDVIKIDFYDNLKDIEAMREAARAFAAGTSQGIFNGCIGALDGWLVKMICPSISRDGNSKCGGIL